MSSIIGILFKIFLYCSISLDFKYFPLEIFISFLLISFQSYWLGNGNTSDSFITIPDVEIVDVFNNNLDKYNLKLNKNMDNTIYEVYRIYSVDDEYIETLLI